MFSKRSVETPRLISIMITTHANMTYHEYQGMFDFDHLKKKKQLNKVAQ